MRLVWTIALAVAALAIPVSASAVISPADYKNAAKFCKALRADIGTTAFKQAYDPSKSHSKAFGKCVSKSAHELDENHSDSVKSCRAERDANEAEFIKNYATNKRGTNAFGKCVSAKDDQAEDVDHDAIVNAAKTCKAERAKDPGAFRDHYGTNHNKRNAFGKCVSKLARENEQEQESNS